MNMNEKKYLDFDAFYGTYPTTPQDVPATWSIKSVISAIQQGTTASTRIGDKVFVHAVHFSVTIGPKVTGSIAGTAFGGSVCRLIAWHNKEAAGALISANTLFDENAYNAQREVPKMPSCTILKDMTHNMSITAMNGGSTVQSAGPNHFYQFAIYPKKKICFTGNTQSAADLLKDDYGLGVCADSATCCVIYCRAKVIFSDM